jgi:hypothetical protein
MVNHLKPREEQTLGGEHLTQIKTLEMIGLLFGWTDQVEIDMDGLAGNLSVIKSCKAEQSAT